MHNFRIRNKKNINVSLFKFSRSKSHEGTIKVMFLKEIAINNDFIDISYIRSRHRSTITELYQFK